jgi:hypothetical protein
VDGETLDQLLIAADQAMYRVKSSHKLERSLLMSENGKQSEDDGLVTISLN